MGAKTPTAEAKETMTKEPQQPEDVIADIAYHNVRAAGDFTRKLNDLRTAAGYTFDELSEAMAGPDAETLSEQITIANSDMTLRTAHMIALIGGYTLDYKLTPVMPTVGSPEEVEAALNDPPAAEVGPAGSFD